ncbi:MAG: UDP-N-acetylmuramoyl-L-alanyl-D-glutamate--2,6-diaminopimelate ligase [Candidatus Omnitrophica bacterium]|nr:UDP-N-acetylmuramoyl-L-alanyl-D-glutamate--2,6-diaminopimelate ligase [Candidatus Omnitrophota bacterium]
MNFKKLLQESGLPFENISPELTVKGLTCDSRKVEAGYLYIAVKGVKQDGSEFIPQALERGACAVVTESEFASPVPVIRIPDSRSGLAALAQTWFERPSSDLTMVGVTGTNGKTTVSYLVQHLFQQAGLPCGLIGTVEYRVGSRPSPSRNTTPGPLELAALLDEMRSEGLVACSMEVSSHALDQRRVEGVHFDVGVFTNLTPEHLDYHGTIEKYLEAKAILFCRLSSQSAAVLNADDPASDVIRTKTRARVLTFGVEGAADVKVTPTRCDVDGSVAQLQTPAGEVSFRTTLVGRHNLSNLAAAAAVAAALEIPLETFVKAVADFPGVPGRLEPVSAGQAFPVYVDYAHTDDALENVLKALTSVSDRKIILVFGCGGDRDRTKRPRMGAVAGRCAHRVILTSDNPRSEPPEKIAEEIIAGIAPGTSYTVILDRRQAIQQAIQEADAQSLVLIAGKGHETVQIFGESAVQFDDRVVAREALSQMEGVRT